MIRENIDDSIISKICISLTNISLQTIKIINNLDYLSQFNIKINCDR